MLLHRYFGSHAYETLKEAKLKTSRISDFNDPFEFLYISAWRTDAKKVREYILSQLDSPEFQAEATRCVPGFTKAGASQHIPKLVAGMISNRDKLIEQDLESRQELTDKYMRVVCFSAADVKPSDEILMWSHYAAKHSGVRVGFEFPDGIRNPFMIAKIEYCENRVEVDYSFGSPIEEMKTALTKSATTKSLAWSYENEFRLITLPEHCETRTCGNSRVEHFLTFNREWVKTVDFGVRCPPGEIRQVVDLLEREYPHVIRQRAEFHNSQYALEYKRT